MTFVGTTNFDGPCLCIVFEHTNECDEMSSRNSWFLLLFVYTNEQVTEQIEVQT